MSSPTWFSRLMITVIAFTLCGGPQLAAAQQAAPAPQTEQPATPPAVDNPSVDNPAVENNDQHPQPAIGTTPDSATPDPSKGPLKPSDNELPNAPSASQQQQTSSSQQTQEPEVKKLRSALPLPKLERPVVVRHLARLERPSPRPSSIRLARC